MKRRLMSLVLMLAIFIGSVPFATVSSQDTVAASATHNGSQSLSEQDDSLNIYFFPLNPSSTYGSYASGDSFIITYGKYEILVDAGPTRSTSEIITKKMEEVISEDGVWDYIIVTHSDYDHIAAFPGGVFDKFKHSNDGEDNRWTLGTFIDFDVTKDETVSFNGKNDLFTSATYGSYATQRGYIVEASDAQYYTASQCCYEKRELSDEDKEKIPEGATDTFTFGAATITILYNYFYDHRINEEKAVTSADRNILSVCFMIELGEQKFLFTGDIEEYDSATKSEIKPQIYGETKLLEHNMDKLKDGVTFYKAAHHGSFTSSCSELIDVIRPDYVVISAVAGTNEYTDNMDDAFPSQVVTDNLFKYTDKIYITEEAVNEKDDSGKTKTVSAKPYHGNITVTADGEKISVTTDNYWGMPIQDTPWFKENRTVTMNTFVFAMPTDIMGTGHCTLLKYGSLDVLIDCGINGRTVEETNTMGFVGKVAQYCRDGVLEYVIITNAQNECISNMIGGITTKSYAGYGIMDIFTIETLIDFGTNTNMGDSAGGWLYNYRKKREELKESGQIKIHIPAEESDLIKQTFYLNGDENFTLKLFNTENMLWQDENDYSLCCLFTFYGKKLLFTGDMTATRAKKDKPSPEELLVSQHGAEIKNVDFYLVGLYGSNSASSKVLLNVIKPKYSVVNATAMDYIEHMLYPSIYAVKRIEYHTQKIGDTKNVYLTRYIGDEGIEDVCGDMMFSIKVKNGVIDEKTGMSISCLNKDNELITIDKTDWYLNAQ